MSGAQKERNRKAIDELQRSFHLIFGEEAKI